MLSCSKCYTLHPGKMIRKEVFVPVRSHSTRSWIIIIIIIVRMALKGEETMFADFAVD
jgi:hypothetical protein